MDEITNEIELARVKKRAAMIVDLAEHPGYVELMQELSDYVKDTWMMLIGFDEVTEKELTEIRALNKAIAVIEAKITAYRSFLDSFDDDDQPLSEVEND